MAEQTVELSPGESKQVSFEAIPHEAKTYQVLVNGLTGSFVAVIPPVASLRGTVLNSRGDPVERTVYVGGTYERLDTTYRIVGYLQVTHSDPETGIFRFEGLPVGKIDIWVRDWPYPMSRSVALVEGLNVVGPYIVSD